MSINNALNAAIFSKLSGDSTLVTLLGGGTAIYYQQAPDNADLPYVVFSHPSRIDENQSAHRTKNGLVFARAYAASPAQAGTIDARLDTLLHMKPLTVSGWSNFWIAREQDLESIEVDAANVKTWMVGANYRVRVEKTS